MITTAEQLIDPVAYTFHNVVTDVSAQNMLDAAGHLIVSGADFDVLVQKHAGEPLTIGRKDFIVSRMLGNLYTGGVAEGLEYDGNTLELTWFPSPARSNHLAEQLGLVVGRDVLRFVHAATDEVSSTRYRAHLANGEYPQSTGKIYFGHDRNYDHAVAVLTMPPFLTKHVMDMCTQYTDKDILKADKSLHGKSFVTLFDNGTGGMRRIAEILLYGDRGLEALTNLEHYSLDYAYQLMPHEPVKYKKLKEAKQVAIMQYVDYYRADLLPKIAALQATVPKLLQQSGVTVLSQ